MNCGLGNGRAADRAKQSQFLDCGFRIGDCGLGTRLRRETCLARRLGPAQANRAKQSQFSVAGISHHTTILSARRSRPIPTVLNKPNFNRYRPDQTPRTWDAGQLCKTNPIRHPAPKSGPGRSCETKPIGPPKVSGGDAQPTKNRIVRNKAKLGRTRGRGQREPS